MTDDAGISLAYARTFASGQGLRLTPLSPRVEAYSDPLWVLWLALGYALHLGGPMFAHVSGAVFGAAAVLLLAFRTPLRWYDAVAPWLLALDTTYNFWTGSGLETGAFALCMVLAMRGSALAAGLLCLLRPEGPLYVVLLAPLAASRKPRAASRGSSPAAVGVGGDLPRGSDILRWLAIALAPFALWLLFRRAYYAQWLPNAFFAKRRWDYGGFWYLNAWFMSAPWHWALYAAPLALLARGTRRAALKALPGCLAAVAFILYSKGDWMSEHRFAAHALPAAALAAGLVPQALQELFGDRDRDLGWAAAAVLLAVAVNTARLRGPDRRRVPELPLAYVADQGRWFRDTARRLGIQRPRVAHFDLGGVALESGGEVVDLAGLADLYIGRVGYQDQQKVRDYLFGEVKPDMLNVHGPCQYLRDDPRLQRDYLMTATGAWGENWVRKTLELDGIDERCPPRGLPRDLPAALEKAPPREARDLWLCARAHLSTLPDVSRLARKLAAAGTKDSLEAATTLDPTLPTAAAKLLSLRLNQPARQPDVRPRK